MADVLTIEQVAASFSEDIPEWQANANLNWLRNLYSLMKDGGVWGSPGLGTVYQKQGDGWILLEQLGGN